MEHHKEKTNSLILPQRYVVAIMGFLAVLNAYTIRISLSIAITEMVAYSGNKTNPSDDTCSYAESSAKGPIISEGDRYNWDEATQGLILSSFYWGYLLSHMPGGILAEHFGGKYPLGLGILAAAVFTLITPPVARTGSWKRLCFLRFCIGLGEGTLFPALSSILAKWVPPQERSAMSGLAFPGSLLGTVIGNTVSGIVIEATQDWASVFYLFGSLGILWFVIWIFICYSDPQSHPFISDEEKSFLKRELSSVSCEKKEIPWKHVFTSIPLWALIIAQVGHDWGFYTMVTDLPKYMKDVLKFRISENGVWSSIPYVLMWFVSMGSGWLCDWLIRKGYMGVTFARKFFTTICSIGPGIFILAASYAGCNRVATVILFTIGMGLMGTFYCGTKVNAIDLAPNYAGTLMAIENGIGTISGIVAPYLIGILTPDHTLTQWRLVFWITLGILILKSIVFVCFASGEEQWWNTVGVYQSSKTNDTKEADEDL